MRMRASFATAIVGLCVLATTTFAQDAACPANAEQVKVTFYGWPDNDPPGPGIKCEVEHRTICSTCSSLTSDNNSTTTATRCGPRGETAGGDGTFANPLSMASSGKWFCWQEVVYMPFLKKYVRYEDYCQQCIDDARAGNQVPHIDIWTGSNRGGGGRLQIKCEETLTPDGTVAMVRRPGPDMPVDLTDLYLRNGTGRGFCNGTLGTGDTGDTGSNTPAGKGIAASSSSAMIGWFGLIPVAYQLMRVF